MASQMQTFKFLFDISLSELILRHTDKLSQTLQMPKLSSVEGQGIAMLTVRTLKTMRTAEKFNLFRQKVEKMRFQEVLVVDEPQLPRRRKAPRCFEEDSATSEFPLSVDEYRLVYFEAIDLFVMSFRNRFDQKGFQTFSNVEQLQFKACTGQCFKEELDSVCSFFFDDFDKIELESQLCTLHQLYSSVVVEEMPSIDSIKIALLNLSTAQRMLVSAVSHLAAPDLTCNKCNFQTFI